MKSLHFIPDGLSIHLLDFIFSKSKTSAEIAWSNIKGNLAINDLDPSTFQLLPLLYWRSKSLKIQTGLEHELRHIYLKTWEANEITFSKFKAVKDAFRNNKISFIPLKGYTVSLSYYPDSATRPMGDIDVLIKPVDLESAMSVLERLGFRPKTPLPKALKSAMHAFLYIKDGEDISIDVHSQITHGSASYQLNDLIWEASQMRYFDDHEELQLSQTDLIFNILAHGLLFSPVPTTRWIPDTLFTIANNPAGVDWGRLVHMATQTRLGVLIAKQLSFLDNRYEVSVPKWVLSSLSNQKLGRIERFSYSFISGFSHFKVLNRLRKQYHHLLFDMAKPKSGKFLAPS